MSYREKFIGRYELEYPCSIVESKRLESIIQYYWHLFSIHSSFYNSYLRENLVCYICDSCFDIITSPFTILKVTDICIACPLVIVFQKNIITFVMYLEHLQTFGSNYEMGQSRSIPSLNGMIREEKDKEVEPIIGRDFINIFFFFLFFFTFLCTCFFSVQLIIFKKK